MRIPSHCSKRVHHCCSCCVFVVMDTVPEIVSHLNPCCKIKKQGQNKQSEMKRVIFFNHFNQMWLAAVRRLLICKIGFCISWIYNSFKNIISAEKLEINIRKIVISVYFACDMFQHKSNFFSFYNIVLSAKNSILI